MPLPQLPAGVLVLFGLIPRVRGWLRTKLGLPMKSTVGKTTFYPLGAFTCLCCVLASCAPGTRLGLPMKSTVGLFGAMCGWCGAMCRCLA